jgi:hypothetical protein
MSKWLPIVFLVACGIYYLWLLADHIDNIFHNDDESL